VQNKNILIVDDEKPVVTVIQTALLKSPYIVHTASKVEAAFELFVRVRPFLLLCDLKLENHVDGATLAGMIRREDPYVVNICMTGSLSPFDKGYLLGGGAFSDIILKPFDINLLRKIVADSSEKFNRWKAF